MKANASIPQRLIRTMCWSGPSLLGLRVRHTSVEIRLDVVWPHMPEG
jgi:hypothetical protein